MSVIIDAIIPKRRTPITVEEYQGYCSRIVCVLIALCGAIASLLVIFTCDFYSVSVDTHFLPMDFGGYKVEPYVLGLGLFKYSIQTGSPGFFETSSCRDYEDTFIDQNFDLTDSFDDSLKAAQRCSIFAPTFAVIGAVVYFVEIFSRRFKFSLCLASSAWILSFALQLAAFVMLGGKEICDGGEFHEECELSTGAGIAICSICLYFIAAMVVLCVIGRSKKVDNSDKEIDNNDTEAKGETVMELETSHESAKAGEKDVSPQDPLPEEKLENAQPKDFGPDWVDVEGGGGGWGGILNDLWKTEAAENKKTQVEVEAAAESPKVEAAAESPKVETAAEAPEVETAAEDAEEPLPTEGEERIESDYYTSSQFDSTTEETSYTGFTEESSLKIMSNTVDMCGKISGQLAGVCGYKIEEEDAGTPLVIDGERRLSVKELLAKFDSPKAESVKEV